MRKLKKGPKPEDAPDAAGETAYQVYIHLYNDTVLPKIREAYDTYRSLLGEGTKPRHFLAFMKDEAEKMLAGESEEIRKEVEEFRKKTRTGIGLHMLYDPDADAETQLLQKRAHAIQE